MEFSNSSLTDWQQCFSTQRTFPTLNEKLTIGLPLLFLNIIATISNVILVYYNLFIVLKSKAQQNNPSYQVLILVNHFAIANIGYCIVNFMGSIPGILSPSIIYSSDWAMMFTAGFNTHFYLTILFLNFLIAFERFIYFFELFSKNIIAILRKKLPIFVWIFAFACGIGTEISGCHKMFNQWAMTYVFTCATCGKKGDFQVSAIYNYTGLYGPFGLITMYAAVFILIFKNKWKIGIGNGSNNNALYAKQEVKVAINFFVICISQWFLSTMFFYARFLFGNTLLTPFITNVAGVLNALTQPIALILCNKRARRQLMHYCKRGGDLTIIGNISMTIPKHSKEQRRN